MPKKIESSKNVYGMVSDDESLIYSYVPENKAQSAIWLYQNEEKPRKAVRSPRCLEDDRNICIKIATIPLQDRRMVNVLRKPTRRGKSYYIRIMQV